MAYAATVASAAAGASVEAVANRLVFYDVDRLEAEVLRLEQMVGWLDGYSQDLLARAQAARRRPTAASAAHAAAGGLLGSYSGSTGGGGGGSTSVSAHGGR